MAIEVLTLRAAGIGDLLTAVPALRALAQGHSRKELTVAAPDWLHPLVGLIPGVTRAVGIDGLMPRQDLSACLVFNMHGRGPQSHQALLRANPRELVAFACPTVWECGPEWFIDPDEPERARFCRLVQWVGIDADPDQLGIKRPHVQVPRGRVVLHVGGSDPERRWPPGHFAQLIPKLHGHDLVVTGGPGDVVRAQQVAHEAQLPGDRVLAGRLDLAQFAALVAEARLLVTADTGAAHLAHAYGVASVVIFGPASTGQWGPPDSVPSTVVQAAGTHPRASDVPVADVEKVVLLLLEES